MGTYEEEVSTHLTLDKLGIYNLWGNDESTATAEVVCEKVGGIICDLTFFPMAAESVKTMLYYAQLMIEQRF